VAVVHLVGDYPIHQTIQWIKQELPKTALSLEFVDEGSIDSDSYLMVYEKYFMRVKNRVSLSIMLKEVNQKTEIIAIGSGAGQGALFSFDWGSELDFVIDFTRLMESFGYMKY